MERKQDLIFQHRAADLCSDSVQRRCRFGYNDAASKTAVLERVYLQ